MRTCKEISEISVALHEGNGPVDAFQWVQDHLSECPDCRNFQSGLSAVGALAKAASRSESVAVAPGTLAAFNRWANASRSVATATHGRWSGFGVATVAMLLSLVLAFLTAPHTGPEAMTLGRSLVCSVTHLAGAALPGVLVFLLGAPRMIKHAPGLVGAAVATGALIVQGVDRCPSSTSLQHQLVFHTGAVFFAVVSAVVVTRMWTATQMRTR